MAEIEFVALGCNIVLERDCCGTKSGCGGRILPVWQPGSEGLLDVIYESYGCFYIKTSDANLTPALRSRTSFLQPRRS